MSESTSELVIVNEPTYDRFVELVDLIFESETWRINYYDYKVYLHGLDKMWLFLNVEKKSRKIIAGVSLGAANGSESPIYSIGFYFCHPDFRGKGYGNQLFKMAMDIVGNSNCCLTGVPNMVELYANRYGFNKYPKKWHLQSKIYTKDIVFPQLHNVDNLKILDFKDVNLAKFHIYDRQICNIERKKFLEAWIECALCTKVVVNNFGDVVGYGTIRKIMKNRLALAPLYADNLDVATLIFSNLLQSVENLSSFDLVLTTYPDDNEDCKKLLQSFTTGEIPTYIEQKIQFTQSIIAVPDHKVYGITEGGHSFT